MFDLSNVEENAGGGKRLYIYPGVLNVTIVGWESGESATGTPFISVELVSNDALEEGTENATKKFQFYMSEKAKDQSLVKVKHIVTKVTKEANMKPATDLAGFAAMLNSITKGKTYRHKFTGEEYEYNGEVKVAARIGLPKFAEATQPGAEYEAVAEADTELVYDVNNQYDFKKLAKDATEVTAATTAPGTSW
jgi:hypothetical protein